MEPVPQFLERPDIAPHPHGSILVVDDDPDILFINVEVLRRAGYSVDAAEDGALAWAALQARSYDLLLTDNNMPHMPGTALLKALREAGMTLPVIVATGTLSDEEIGRNPALETAFILLKPYTLEMLLGTVKGMLQNKVQSVESTKSFDAVHARQG